MVAPEATFLVPLIVAAFLGAALGLERSIAGKQAGMRTYALVSLGSCLFTIVGTLASFQFMVFSSVNPLHLAGFVAVGVGFIGAGLSAARGDAHAELTTATGIWLVAGIGLACGFKFYTLAVVSTILGILIFSLLLRVENAIRNRAKKQE